MSGIARTKRGVTMLGMAFGALLLIAASAPAARADEAADQALAAGLVKQFATELQDQLKRALQAGGPVFAIPTCAEAAPAIAARLSRESGAYVRRISLKTRNPQATPDAWEQEVLRGFDARAAAGDDPATLAKAAYVEEPVGRSFRFVKAIPVQPLCLACHGEQLAPEVEQALAARYPHDTARGYREGMVRGAFSVKLKSP